MRNYSKIENSFDIITKEYVDNRIAEATGDLQGKGNFITVEELEGKGFITNDSANSKFQLKGTYLTPAALSGYIKTVDADSKYQPKGEYQAKGDYVTVAVLNGKSYLTTSEAARLYQGKGDYITRTELTEKNYVSETVLNQKGYVTNSEVSESYQPKGDYITESELNDKGYITEPIADNKYQPIGDYVTNNTLIGKKYIDENKLNSRGFITEVKADGRYQVKGNYITESELISKDYITKASASSLYQAKGDYVTNTSINNKLGNYVKTTDLKANTVPTSDGSSNVEAEINNLKSKTTDLKPRDFKSNNKNKLITNIEFNSASKTLNISYINNETSGIENLSIPYTTTGDLVDTKIDTHLSKKLNTVLDEILNKQSNIVATDIKGNTDKRILTNINISTNVLSLFFINENGVRTKDSINISFFANKSDINGCVKPNLLQGSFSEKYMFKISNNPDSYYKRKIGTFSIDDIKRTPIITLSCTIEWDNLEYLNYSSFSMHGEGINNPNLVIMGGEFKITKNSGHVRHVSTITVPSSITEDNRSFDFYILCKYIRNGNINISDTKIEEGEQYTPHILYQPDIYTKNNLPSSKMIGFNLLQSQDYLDNGLIGSVKDLNSNFKVDIVSVTGIKITKISNISEKIRVCRIKTDGLQSGLQDIELKRNHQAIISWSCNIYSSKYMNIHSMGLSSLGNAGYNYNIKSIDTECNIYKTFMFNMKDNTVYFDIFIDDNMKQGDWIIIKDLKIEEGPPTPIENDLKYIDNKMKSISESINSMIDFLSETFVSRSEFEEFKNSLK